jgi:putative ABC transport system permease protein
MFMMYPNYYRRVLMRISPDNVTNTMSHIESVWKKFAPDYPFEYHFLDEQFDYAYRAEQRAGTLFGYFVILAILLSCLGLFGLASFSTEQKTKEIGVRKVLGASVPAIIVLLSKEFTKWVLLANLIAWPIGYFVMKKWLENFAYRTNIGIEIFVGAALIALAIAMLTVSYQSIKAAIANPIKALRYE